MGKKSIFFQKLDFLAKNYEIAIFTRFYLLISYAFYLADSVTMPVYDIIQKLFIGCTLLDYRVV